MIRPILQATDRKLRQKSKPVVKVDKKIRSIITDLKDTLVVQKDPEGVGLAAPQIGKKLRVFIMKLGGTTITVINPKILQVINKGKGVAKKIERKQKKSKILEGCLSLPHYYGPLKRAKFIKIKYLDGNGQEQISSFSDFDAQIIQHEIDHLEGILFIDKLLEQKKPLYEYVNGEWERVELI